MFCQSKYLYCDQRYTSSNIQIETWQQAKLPAAYFAEQVDCCAGQKAGVCLANWELGRRFTQAAIETDDSRGVRKFTCRSLNVAVKTQLFGQY